MVLELPNSSMASNVAVDFETLPTNPLPSSNSSTDPSMTVDRRSNSNSSMDDQNSNPSSPYFLPPVRIYSTPEIPNNFPKEADFLSYAKRNHNNYFFTLTWNRP